MWKDLKAWGAWLDVCSVKRSRIFTGIKGWVMGCDFLLIDWRYLT